MLLMGDGIQQMQWGTARETRPDHGPSMLELASCMKRGCAMKEGEVNAPMSLSPSLRKKSKKRGHKSAQERGGKREERKHIKKRAKYLRRLFSSTSWL